MKFNKKKWLGLILFSSFIVLSCGDKTKKMTDSLNEVVNNASATDADETKKYNAYIDFYNQFLSTNLSKGIDNYISKAGKESTVIKNEEYFSFSDYYSWDKIEENIKAKPSMKEMDAASAELIPISKELGSLLTSAANYYKAKDYLDDKYAKGQELHTKILNLIKKFDEAYAKFDLALRNKEIETRTKEIEQAKSEGYEITYNKILVLQSIDKIMNEVNIQKLDASNVTSADISKIKPIYEEFNKAQKSLRDAIENEEMLKKEGFETFSKSSLKSYVDKTTEFKTVMLDFIDRVEKKKAVDKFRLEHSFSMDREEGAPENLQRVREEVVSSYNSIR